MRHNLLKTIKAEDNLAILFNAYLRKLGSIEIISTPMYSMGEYARLTTDYIEGRENKEATQAFSYCMPTFYHLAVLGQALTDLHDNVDQALEKLNKLFTDYGGDLKRYAIEERMRLIDEYGSDEDSDWVEDGIGPDLQPKWKVVYKDDEQSLEHYQFKADLRHNFTGADARGERIGTSQPVDFARFSGMVERDTDFSPFKILRDITGAELPMYKQNEEGEMVRQSLADEIESEINDDLRNQSIVAYFHQALRALNHAAALQCFATTAEHYQELRQLLQNIQDMNLGAAFQQDVAPAA